MALCPQHTFQVLTKRPERMLKYGHPDAVDAAIVKLLGETSRRAEFQWPLPNVWLGVSAENQETADERIPLLLQTPAAKRFVSYEPALGLVDLARYMFDRCMNCDALLKPAPNGREIGMDAALPCGCKYCWHCADNRGRHEDHDEDPPHGTDKLDWVIVGGESGPDARPFDAQWALNVIAQCKAAGVACFVKQLGADPLMPLGASEPRDRKGGNWDEWPADLRVREFPL